MLGIMAVMDQKDSCSGMYKAGITMHVARCSSLVGRPMMFDIMAVMDQKDSCDMVPMFGGAEHVDIPVLRGGGLQSLRPGQVSAASSSDSPGAADEVFYKGFSHLSPVRKKVRGWSALGIGTECGLYSVHASSL